MNDETNPPRPNHWKRIAKTVALVGAGHLAGYLGAGLVGKAIGHSPLGQKFIELPRARQLQIINGLATVGTVGGGIAAAALGVARERMRDDDLADQLERHKKTASASVGYVLEVYEMALRR